MAKRGLLCQITGVASARSMRMGLGSNLSHLSQDKSVELPNRKVPIFWHNNNPHLPIHYRDCGCLASCTTFMCCTQMHNCCNTYGKKSAWIRQDNRTFQHQQASCLDWVWGAFLTDLYSTKFCAGITC